MCCGSRRGVVVLRRVRLSGCHRACFATVVGTARGGVARIDGDYLRRGGIPATPSGRQRNLLQNAGTRTTCRPRTGDGARRARGSLGHRRSTLPPRCGRKRHARTDPATRATDSGGATEHLRGGPDESALRPTMEDVLLLSHPHRGQRPHRDRRHRGAPGHTADNPAPKLVKGTPILFVDNQINPGVIAVAFRTDRPLDRKSNGKSIEGRAGVKGAATPSARSSRTSGPPTSPTCSSRSRSGAAAST